MHCGMVFIGAYDMVIIKDYIRYPAYRGLQITDTIYLFIGEMSFRYCEYWCLQNLRLLRKSSKSSHVV